MSLAISSARGAEAAEEPLVPPAATEASLTAMIADPVLKGVAGRGWWIAIACAAPLALITIVAIGWLLGSGIGLLGNNTSVVWGVPIANYVWWIGIGNAGTLISALLLLTRQSWRSSINRFAEAMTLFAVSIAGLFPILHLGRPQYFYWLAPYPNTMTLWPQWRSALVWDFWSIISYLLFSIVFFYVGLLPDLATFRDRSKSNRGRLMYGAFALGWRGSARQWRIHNLFYTTMAGLAVPLVCSVHSIVGLDFAASLMPGWEETIFPPYFVVGAMFSGFAMVVLLAAAIRWGFRFQGILTVRHFEAMAIIILASSLIMALSYATEWFSGWYSGKAAERGEVAFAFTGSYAPLFWLQLVCNCLAPQILWWPRMRRSLPALIVVSLGILVGMWLERILIIWNTLSNGYLPSMRRLFIPTLEDGLLVIAPLGLFAMFFLIFVRFLPAISMHEMRQLLHERERS
jgi:molybdopterin-containing oxidoreductase family membrane subunit